MSTRNPRIVERRSFIWKAGATLSATVASAAALASGGTSRAAHATGHAAELERLASQLRLREDTDAIRQLHRSFMAALNERQACVADSARPCSIEISADRQTATARFPCLMRIETPIDDPSSLVEMARQQGQGVVQHWEPGLHDNSYVKENGSWTVAEVRYEPEALNRRGAWEGEPLSLEPPGD